jgi:chemotaxis protein histidine kinase CheA
MSTSIWLESKASIILLPSGEQGKEIVQLAENWAEVGLLGPALWVHPEQITLQDSAPPLIQATVVGVLPDKSLVKIEVDLFEQLAREDLDVIRLIKLRSATPSRESDEVQDNIVKLIDDYTNFAMPAPDRKMSDLEARTALDVITLICATTEFKAQKRLSQQQRGSGVTILAAPEDRSSPWSTDAFVRDGDRFRGFMLMHLSTVAGIWNGLPVGTMELAESDRPAGTGVWISRVFFSGVLTDGLARRVAADVIQEVGNPNNSLESAPPGTAYIEDSVLDEYVQWMVTYMMTLDEAVLTFRLNDVPQAPGQVDIGIGTQLALLFAFAGQKFVQIPMWAWRWIKGLFSRKIQNQLQGSDGLATVNAGLQREQLDRRDAMILDMFTRIKEMKELANISMQAPVSLTQVRSTPALWARIRDLVFGTLDGGSGRADSGFPLVGDDVRPIFRSVSNLFTHPDFVWSFPEGVKLPEDIPLSFTWENLEQCTRVQTVLHKWVLDSGNKLQEANSNLYSVKERIKVSESTLLEVEEIIRSNGGFVLGANGQEKPITLAQAASKSKAFAAPVTSSAVEEEPHDEEVIDTENSENSRENIDENSTSENDEDTAQVETPKEEQNADSASAETEDPEETAPAEVALAATDENVDTSSDVDLVSLLRQRKSLTQEIKTLKEELSAAEDYSIQLTAEQENNLEVEADFIEWLHGAERSLISKLKAATEEQRQLAQQEADNLQKQAEELTLDEPDRLVKYRRAFHKALLWSFGLISLIAGIFSWWADSKSGRSWFTGQRINPDSVLLYTLIGTILALLIAYFAVASVYYRKWSNYERHIQTLYVELESMAARHVNARREVARLTVIHRQTFEWLDLLARMLYKPWAVRSSWLESGLQTLNTGVLPFSMRVAQANDEDQASRAILRTRASKKLGIIGWRENAFQQFVSEVARVNGRTAEAFSVDVLDKDLPHASNGSRDLLRKNLANVEVLENVALSYLRPIISDLQTNAMATARPTVLQVDDNPLEPLRSDLEGIEDNLKEEKWNDFLRHTLTRGDGKPDPVTPLSALAINEAQVMAANHEDVRSYALMPEHVLEKLGKETLTSIEARSYDAKNVRPLDAVVRVDIAGPLQESQVRVWATAEIAESAPVRGVLEDTAVYESF